MLKRWGVSLPLEIRIAQMILTEASGDALAPTITWQGRRLSLKQTPAGNYLIGGGWQGLYSPRRHSYRLDETAVRSSLRTARGVLPGLTRLGTAAVWCGLESESPDGVPFLGSTEAAGGPPGLHVAVGFSGHGFQISPAVGEAMALLLDGKDAGDVTAGLEPGRTRQDGSPDGARPAADGDTQLAHTWRNAG
jgi:sarcosine oxidase subunit beta